MSVDLSAEHAPGSSAPDTLSCLRATRRKIAEHLAGGVLVAPPTGQPTRIASHGVES